MEIVGNGFVARHLRHLAAAHPGVVAFAAGVSSTAASVEQEFAREAALLHDTARRCRADGRLLVFFSTASAAMYGGAPCPGTEDGPVLPPAPYGRHKLALESALERSGVDWLVLRLAHLVGPGQPSHQLLPALVAQVRAGNVRVYRRSRRDLLDVADMVTVLDRLLTAGVRREVVNVASGVPVPVDVIVDQIAAALGVTPHREYVEDGDRQHPPASLDKLHRLVPSVADLGFGVDYHRTVLTRYLSATEVPA